MPRQLDSLTSVFGRGRYTFRKECGDSVEYACGPEDTIHISMSEYQRLGRPQLLEAKMVVRVIKR